MNDCQVTSWAVGCYNSNSQEDEDSEDPVLRGWQVIYFWKYTNILGEDSLSSTRGIIGREAMGIRFAQTMLSVSWVPTAPSKLAHAKLMIRSSYAAGMLAETQRLDEVIPHAEYWVEIPSASFLNV